MLKKRIIVFVVSCFFSVVAFAQNVTEKLRRFDSSQLQNWKHDRGFQYQKGIIPRITWWDRFKLWLWEKWIDLMSTEGGSRTFWIVMGIISISAIVFLVSKYMGKTSSIWSKSDKDNLDFESLQNENIHEINFEEKIAKALSSNNYRAAIRLRYLYILKTLDDRGTIHWQSGKTNYDYVLEVRSQANDETYQLFKQISIAFDFAWYGEHDATLDNYNDVKSFFDQLQPNSFTTINNNADERI